MKIAILVDGGFYRKRAKYCFGEKSGIEAANDLYNYSRLHLKDGPKGRYVTNDLYRIFYYDAPPVSKKVYHPLLKRTIDFSKSKEYKWMNDFLKELTKKRKVALRLGYLAENFAHYNLKYDIIKKLFNNSITISDIKENDFELNVKQKTVDMKIGLDIASLAFKKQVDQIVLIAGDGDFVPAAKLARREGIDFIVDSMGRKINDSLFIHIDGFNTKIKLFNKRYKINTKEVNE
ncbi:MAG: NYN domain-containing protein [Ruminococcaceae bacterium]|nr:NYN domain-containing protein [Oscillospiraceae bacterium]